MLLTRLFVSIRGSIIRSTSMKRPRAASSRAAAAAAAVPSGDSKRRSRKPPAAPAPTPEVEGKEKTASKPQQKQQQQQLARCPWADTYTGAAAAAYVAYHDTEWGRPEHSDTRLFELLVLEGAQAGLSWSTILGKRDAYRRAFDGFDPAKVAAFDDARLAQLLAEGSGVVRHRGKLASAVNNAKVVLELQRQHGSFDAFVWGFVGGRPIVSAWARMEQVPTSSPESEALSLALKRAGMKFVGPTTVYAFLQAVGCVNDHLVGCHCRQAIIDAYDG